jgi:hypothetical protein
VEGIAFIWSFWLCRNDKVFNDKKYSILQFIYKAISTLRLWSSLQRLEDRDLFTKVCVRLEATTRDTFSNIDDRIDYELLFQFRRDYN